MTPDQFAKLPRYAQREIDQLKRALRDLTAERDELRRQVAADPEGSNTFVDTYGVRPDQPLGECPLIRFDTAHGPLTARLGRSEKGHLQVSSSNGGLTVSPVASNVVEIQVAKR